MEKISNSNSNSNSPSFLKRERDEGEPELIDEKETYCKRQKSYNDIITLLEEEEDEPVDDLSSLISTLQEEISCPCSDRTEPDPDESDPVQTGVEEVMRHLLEASDDELGIPSTSGNSSGTEMDGGDLLGGGHVDGGDLLLGVGEGLWEFEDHEANNYYNNFLHSEIFI